MAQLTGAAKAGYVRAMFARIPRRYDLINRLMSAGQDLRWRRLAVSLAAPTPEGPALDVATGTADFAIELARRSRRVIGVDFVPEMMRVGQRKVRDRRPTGRIGFVAGDALCLPFPSDTFDCLTTGFAMRNVTDIRRAFAEMWRVVRPGGRMACLELTRPLSKPIWALYRVYFYRLIPFLGGLISGDPETYHYLPNSLTHFPIAEELKRLMEEAGWREVGFRRLNFGTIAIHYGTKPRPAGA